MTEKTVPEAMRGVGGAMGELLKSVTTLIESKEPAQKALQKCYAGSSMLTDKLRAKCEEIEAKKAVTDDPDRK